MGERGSGRMRILVSGDAVSGAAVDRIRRGTLSLRGKRSGNRLFGYEERMSMATWNSRGLRGSTLEELVNQTNELYRNDGLALIQKIPTPITPIEIDKQSRHITLAYFEQKSTVDYIGAVQGIPVCFDAKECASDTFPLANIHEHQLRFMEDFEKQDGIAFFLLYFTERDRLYYLRLTEAGSFWERAQKGGRKSFRIDELTDSFFFSVERGFFIPYLEVLQRDLDLRG